ncbi:MAG: hypothetical protein R3B68_06525 [Phycisphaerales bacterium]
MAKDPPRPRSLRKTLRALLHEAHTPAIFVPPFRRRVQVWVHALRQDGRGNLLSDPVVLTLAGDLGVAACYAPQEAHARARDLVVERPMSVRNSDGLVANLPQQSMVGVPDASQIDQVLAYPRVDWLLGDSCPGRHMLMVASDMETPDSRLLISYARLSVAALAPLSLDEWWTQLGHWDRAWMKHWNIKDSGEIVLPGAEFDDEPDLYPELARFPYQPRVDLEPTRMPRALVAALRDWCAQQEEDEPGDRLHPGIYLREVASWWVEGRWACATVRGIEQEPAWGGRKPMPAAVRTWSFRMFREDAGWTVKNRTRREDASADVRAARRSAWAKRWQGPAVE